MSSRRDFLRIASAAAGALCAPHAVVAGPGLPDKTSLPRSIASLKSMKDQATPVTVEERHARIEQARRLMLESGLDAMMLTSGTSLVYFSNINWWPSERLFALILPATREPFFVCPAFERERAEEQITKGPFPRETEVRVWEEGENPYEKVAQGLRDRGISTGRLGVEETVRFVFSDGVARQAPALTLVSATPVTAGCRMRKTPHEIELMRLAAKVTLTAYQAAWRALRPGMTQHQFAELVAAAHTQLGFPGEAEVQVGPNSALPHGSIQPQVIKENAVLLVDGGCRVEGYSSDISRTFVLGKPADKMRKVFGIVHRAQSAALATARPGVSCEAVDAAARQVIADAGYGPGYKYFTHRVGHGMGMDGHEWPYLVESNTLPLAAHMVFSNEPGIYLRGEFGVRLEDDMHILEEGAELFTPQSPSLEHPFGA